MAFGRHALRLAFALLVVRGDATRAGLRGADKVTPVEKVMELLKQLQTQLEGESRQEAAQYDKYACFCKEQVDEKQYLIEKSDKKIEKLGAEITALDADIILLNDGVAELAQSIAALEAEIKSDASARATEHESYSVTDKDMRAAVAALEGAIEALKASKSEMSGAKLDLAQKTSRAAGAVAKLSAVAFSQKQLDAVNVLSQLGQDPAAYEYHSNDIIATLDGLRKYFLQKKKDLDTAEFESNSAWEKRDTNLKNTMDFQGRDKAEKEKISAYKQELMQKAEAEKTEEEGDKAADGNFLEVLKGQCEEKAQLFEQRSTMRAGELTAIAGALSSLESGVAPSYGANKKLVGLQAAKGHWVWMDSKSNARTAPSFLQERSVRRGAGREVTQLADTRQVAELLSSAGKRIQSPVLALASLRVHAAEDHFVKVRQLIKDLMARLEADAESEQTQKTFCDEAMSAAITSRDSANGELETLAATKASLESERAILQQEIGELSAAIAASKKALIETTELRNAERTENEKTISTAEGGKAAVEMALQFLRDFYEGTATALVQGKYVPPNSGRDGKTVSDKAPEVFDDTYHGDQTKSKGILGLLEVILSDFDRTLTTVAQQEEVAQAAFEQFKEVTEADIATKTTDKETKEARVVAIGDELMDNSDSTREQAALLSEAHAQLDGLHSQCVAGEETYEDRVAKRLKEIEALKQALSILESWQS